MKKREPKKRATRVVWRATSMSYTSAMASGRFFKQIKVASKKSSLPRSMAIANIQRNAVEVVAFAVICRKIRFTS